MLQAFTPTCLHKSGDSSRQCDNCLPCAECSANTCSLELLVPKTEDLLDVEIDDDPLLDDSTVMYDKDNTFLDDDSFEGNGKY